MKYTIRGDERSSEITAEKREFYLWKSLLECFHISKNTNEPNVIQLIIKYSQNKYERVIELRSISGV